MNEGDTVEGSSRFYVCDKSTKTEGITETRCLKNGTWSKIDMYCRRTYKQTISSKSSSFWNRPYYKLYVQNIYLLYVIWLIHMNLGVFEIDYFFYLFCNQRTVAHPCMWKTPRRSTRPPRWRGPGWPWSAWRGRSRRETTRCSARGMAHGPSQTCTVGVSYNCNNATISKTPLWWTLGSWMVRVLDIFENIFKWCIYLDFSRL